MLPRDSQGILQSELASIILSRGTPLGDAAAPDSLIQAPRTKHRAEMGPRSASGGRFRVVALAGSYLGVSSEAYLSRVQTSSHVSFISPIPSDAGPSRKDAREASLPVCCDPARPLRRPWPSMAALMAATMRLPVARQTAPLSPLPRCGAWLYHPVLAAGTVQCPCCP